MAAKPVAGAGAGGGAATASMDDVAGVAKWRDRIDKETRFLGTARPAEFSLNVRSLKTVTGKVGAVDRTHVTAESALQRTRDVATLKETLAKAERSPQAKAPRPMTVSQEVGWFWREAEREPDFLHSTQKVCDEVKYASVYYETFHCGPFSRTQTVAR